MLYSVLSVGMILLLLSFIYWATAGYMDRQLDVTLDEEISALSAEYQEGGLAKLTQFIDRRMSADEQRQSVYLLVDKNYHLIIGNLRGWPIIKTDKKGHTYFFLRDAFSSNSSPGLPSESRSQPEKIRAQTLRLKDGLHLLVGRTTQALDTTEQLIFDALILGGLFTAILSLLVGSFVGRRVFDRLEAINQTSQQIMAGDFSQRISLTDRDDEFDHLAMNLNQMLDRIEALMTSFRQVSDNIAHDMRTPLSRLHLRLAELLSVESKDEPQQQAIAQAILDVEEMLAMFNALLRIARIESGQAIAKFNRLNLTQLVKDVAELYEPLISDKSQTLNLNVTQAYWIDGDRDLLFQLLINLLDNAMKYSPEGGSICIRVEKQKQAPDQVVVTLSDTGIGISASQREQVFQRFYRTDQSRHTPGTGLGLSLVKAIAEIHEATIQLEDNQPGLTVAITFMEAKKMA